MQQKPVIRTPAAAYVAARSLAVSSTVAQSGSTIQSKLRGVIGRVVPSMVGSRLECFKASTSPDAFIPSRIADLMTKYATQHARALESVPMTIESKKKFPIACVGFIGLPVACF